MASASQSIWSECEADPVCLLGIYLTAEFSVFGNLSVLPYTRTFGVFIAVPKDFFRAFTRERFQ